MAIFRYKVINRQGKRQTGDVSAHHLLSAEQQLVAQGMTIISLTERSSRSVRRSWIKPSVSDQDILQVTYQLAHLLRAGLSLLDVMAELRSLLAHRPVIGDVMARVYDDLVHGHRFSDALARHPEVFDDVYVGLVAVGENSHQLPMVLQMLYDRLQWSMMVRRKIRKMMTYPIIALSLMLLVTGLLMVFLVPELLMFVKGIGQEIGWMTRSLMWVSEFLTDYGGGLLLVVLLAWLGFRWSYDHIVQVPYGVHRILLSLGIVGRILHGFALARMTSVMAMMYASGMNVHDLLRLSSGVLGNVYLMRKMTQVHTAVLSGQSLSEAFANVDLLSDVAIKLIKVGEASGNMDESLRVVSDYYDREAQALVDHIEPLIDPIMTLLLALLLGWIILATLVPVYDVMSQVR